MPRRMHGMLRQANLIVQSRRRAVSEQLRTFLHKQVSEGVDELWLQAQQKIGRTPPEPHDDKQRRS